MIYAVYAITALYAILSSIAALIQMKTSKGKATSLIMLIGGVILIAAIFLNILQIPYGWIAAISGGLAICAAAFINGKKSGNFHAIHHVIRFIVTALLVTGFIVF